MRSPPARNRPRLITACTYRLAQLLEAARSAPPALERTIREILGLILIVYGVSMISEIAAVILAGLILFVGANLAAIAGGRSNADPR